MARSLPHSIELRALLLMNNGDTEAVDNAIARYDRFCARWNDTSYPVLGAPPDDGFFCAAFEEALDKSGITLEYVSRSRLANEPPASWVEKLLIAGREDFIRELRDAGEHDDALRKAENAKLFGRGLEDIISSTLGSRRLQLALDNSFGGSFGRPVKHDILMIWQTYFSHVLGSRMDQAKRLEKLIDLERTNPILGRSAQDHSHWLIWVH